MKKIILIILLLGLTGCNQSVDLGGGIITKEYNVKGEKVFVGGEQMFGATELTEVDFKPEVKLEKWQDETYVKVWSEETGDKTATQDGDKVIWNNEDKSKEYNFYPIDNGFEYEIILKEKPKTNVISLKIETKDLVFYYQPPLDEEQPEGETCQPIGGAMLYSTSTGESAYYCFDNKTGEITTTRPENVVGSYAVYHATKANHVVGQTDYKTGKAFHIYRPQMEDADGWKVWGDLHIEKGILTVIIPQDFLDKAVYPIKHATGLTFGYEVQGGSISTLPTYGAYRYKVTSGLSAGVVDSIHIGGRGGGGGGNFDLAGAIYYGNNIISNGESPTENVAFVFTNDWEQIDYSTKPSISSSTDYYLAADSGDSGTYVYYINYDSGGDENEATRDTIADTIDFADPWSADNSYTRNFSIYVTYTASGGEVSSTCTYDTGDWKVHYSDNCFITSDPSVDGDIYLQYDGAGSFSSIADISLTGEIIADAGFTIELGNGAGFSVK